MDLYFQGLAWLNKGLTPDNVAQARGFFDRALTADPDNVDALIGSAGADVCRGLILFVADPKAAFAAAEAKLTKALSSVPDHARAHLYLGLVDIFTKRAAEGIAECEHALELDRNLATAHSTIGLGKILIGRAEETEAHIAEALRLSPRDTLAYIWMTQRGCRRRTTSAIGSRRSRGFDWRSRPTETIRYHILCWPPRLAQLGRLDEAHSAVKAGSRAQPELLHLPRPRPLDGDKRRPDISWPSSSLFSTACARPESPNNDRRPPARRDLRRRVRLLAADLQLTANRGQAHTTPGRHHARPIESAIRLRCAARP